MQSRSMKWLIAFTLATGSACWITPATVDAQQTKRMTPAAPRELPPETPATFADKINRAHQQAITNARALVTYVDRNQTNLDNNTMRLHCDAIGRALDDALHLLPELSAKLNDKTAKEAIQRVTTHDSQAKRTYQRMLGMLRGSSITVPEIKMLATTIEQDVTAADQELLKIGVRPATDSTVVAQQNK